MFMKRETRAGRPMLTECFYILRRWQLMKLFWDFTQFFTRYCLMSGANIQA